MPFRGGDRLEDARTGTVVVFRKTAAETGGRAVVVELLLPPNGLAAAEHLHPRQVERVEVIAGSVGVRVGRRRAVVGSGARITVPPGTPHRFWNAGDETAQLVAELAPALGIESYLAASAALAARPSAGLLARAVVAADHFDTVRAPFPPAPLQRLALALAAPLGRRR